jgi:hypothetical protein
MLKLETVKLKIYLLRKYKMEENKTTETPEVVEETTEEVKEEDEE